MVATVASQAAGSIRVALVASVCVAREGLRVLLERDPALVVDYHGDPSPESVASLSQRSPGVILIDGACQQCLSALSDIRVQLLETPIVVYGVQPVPEVLRLCARGATVVVSQDANVETLVAMVKHAVSGRLSGEERVNAALLEELAARVDGPFAVTPLTRRERQIASAIAEGLTNKAIAERFYISLPTVKSHVHCILRKLGIASRDEVLFRLRDSAAA